MHTKHNPLETKGDSKSTALNIAPSSEQPIAQRKRELFVKILKQEFIRELQYLWDVANDRAAARDTFTSQLVSQFKDLSTYVPLPGLDMVIDKLGSMMEHAANRDRDKRTELMANLMDEIDLGRLEVLLDVVAREALRRYENFIVDRLSEVPEEGVVPFAKIGAHRMLEKLSRSSKRLAKGIGVGLNEATLLAGLVEGRSGAYVEGWSNHKVKLNNKYTKKTFLGKVVNKEVDIEDVYARPGLRDFTLRRSEPINQLYIRRDRGWHQEQPGWDKFVASLKGSNKALYNYGFVRFRKKPHENDPKAGYVVMPLSVIRDRYDYKAQDNKYVSSLLQDFTPSIIAIDCATISAFLARPATQKHLGLRDYVRGILNSPSLEWVECHDSLVGLNVKGENLSHCDFSGAVFSGDLTGTDFSHCYLIATTFRSVTSAQQIIFAHVKAAFLQAEGVNFSGADLTQADFSYAALKGANFTDCKTLGAIWTQADMREVQNRLVVLEREAQTEKALREMDQQRTVLREMHVDIMQRTEMLYQLQQELRQEMVALVNSTHQQYTEKDQAALSELQAQVHNLLEQQTARHSFEQCCQRELATLTQQLTQTADKKQVEHLQSEIATLQTELHELKQSTALKQALDTFREETHARIEQLSTDILKKKLPELEKRLRTEITEQIKMQAQSLSNLEQRVTALQHQLEERFKKLEDRVGTLEQWANTTRVRFEQLQKQIQQADKTETLLSLQREMTAMQAQIAEARKLHADAQTQVLNTLQQQMEKTAQGLNERLQAVEQRLNLLVVEFKEEQTEMRQARAEVEKVISAQRQQQEELLALKRQFQQSADIHSLKEVQAAAQKLAARMDTLAPLAALQKLQEQLHETSAKLQEEVADNERTQQRVKNQATLLQALQTQSQQAQQQLTQIQASQKLLAEQLAHQQQTQSALQSELGHLQDSISVRLSVLEQRVNVLETWVNDFKQQAQDMKANQDSTTKAVATLQQDLQQVLADKQKDEQRQALYHRELQSLRTQIQTAATQGEVETLRTELEAVKKKLEVDITPPEIKQISARFADLEKNITAEKRTFERLAKVSGQQREQLQAVHDQIAQLEKEQAQITNWQQQWEKQWQTFAAEEKQERLHWQGVWENAQQACEQRVAVLEGRVHILEGFVKDLRQGFSEIKLQNNEFRTRIEGKLSTLEKDFTALRKRDEAFTAERQRYETVLKDYETRIAQAQANRDEKAMQTLQAQVVALEQKLAERPPVLDRELLPKLQALQSDYGQLRQQLQVQAKTNSQLRRQLQTVVAQCAANEQQIAEMQTQTQTLFTQYARHCQEQIAAIKDKLDTLIRLRPEYTLVEKLKTLRERVLADPQLTVLNNRSVKLHGQSDPDAKATSDLTAWVEQNLLQSKDVEVSVIVGDAGCGKSTFFRQLEIAHWQTIEFKQPSLNEPATTEVIPLYIPLGLPWVQAQNVWSYLNQHADYSLRFTAEEINVLQRQYRVLLLVDGYEQLRKSYNLHDVNRISDYQGRVKLLIGCQFAYFQELDENRWFMPKAATVSLANARYRKRFISPLSAEQITYYLEQELSHTTSLAAETKSNTPRWSVQEYQRYLASNPELKQLICYPSLLHVAIEVLPELAATTSAGYSLTRKRLLDHFVNRWFAQKKQELEHTGQLPPRGDIQRRFRKFCQEFARGLERAGVAAVKYPFTDDPDSEAAYEPDTTQPEGPRGSWVKNLFGDPQRALERHASPLKVSPRSEHQFLHPSFKDYFISVGGDVDAETLPPLPSPAAEAQPKTPVSDKKPSAPLPAPRDEVASPTSSADATLIALQRGILPYEQIQLWADRVQEEPGFKDILFQFIEASKQEADKAIAAANAATILNAAGINLSQRDWSGVRIAGADLSGGLLDGTNFANANLDGINLQGAWLRSVNFTGASLANIRLGEWPYLAMTTSADQASYAPNGQWLVVASGSQLHLFDANDYRLIREWTAHDKPINQFACNAAGTELVSTGGDQTLRVWNLAQGTLLHKFTQTSALLKSPGEALDEEEAAEQMNWSLLVSNGVTYHPKDNIIVSGGLEGRLEVHPSSEAKVEKVLPPSANLKPGQQQIQSLSWEASGRYIGAGRVNREVTIWDLQTNQAQTLREHTNVVNAVSFHPQGRYLVTGGADKVLRAWDITTGKVLQRFEGHRGGVTGISFDLSGERFATSSEDKTVMLWEFATGQVLRQWRGHTAAVKSVSFRPDGGHLASASEDKTVRIWETRARRELRRIKGHRQEVEALAFDGQDKRLYSASSDGVIHIWDLHGQAQGSITTPPVVITALAVDSTRHRLYAGGWDKTIRVWDTKTQQSVVEYKAVGSLVNHLVLDPRGERLAWGGLDGKVRLWEAATGKPLQEYKGITGQVQRLAFDEKGEYLAAASEETELSVWHTKTHQRIVLSGHEQAVSDVCFIPNHPWLASASWDGSLRLWDLTDPTDAVRIYQGHTQPIVALTVDPQGRYLLSASDDQTLCLWDIQQEKSLGSWPLPYPAKTLFWQTHGTDHAITVGTGALIVCFNLTLSGNQPTLKLAWQAGIPSLFVQEACIDQAKGLLAHHARLFSQRGAKGVPAKSVAEDKAPMSAPAANTSAKVLTAEAKTTAQLRFGGSS